MMDQFKKVEISINTPESVRAEVFEHIEENILFIELSGECSSGSQGENYGSYFYQKIGLALLIHQPNAVLVDLRNLGYEYGDRMLAVFNIFSEVRIFGDEEIITAYVLSDKNRYGLSSLLQFNPENPRKPIFYEYSDAYEYLFQEYDKI